MISLQELTLKRDELSARLGPTLRAAEFPEFAQLVGSANEICSTDPVRAEKLRRRAEEMLPHVERSVENILSIRDQIKAKMLQFSEEGMDRYNEALKELSK
jgi:hypothetical protein